MFFSSSILVSTGQILKPSLVLWKALKAKWLFKTFFLIFIFKMNLVHASSFEPFSVNVTIPNFDFYFGGFVFPFCCYCAGWPPGGAPPPQVITGPWGHSLFYFCQVIVYLYNSIYLKKKNFKNTMFFPVFNDQPSYLDFMFKGNLFLLVVTFHRKSLQLEEELRCSFCDWTASAACTKPVVSL